MKKILYLILIICGQFSLAQNSENIDKIKFTYSFGHSSWGKNGIYSRSEIFELIKTENGDYKFSSHLKINDIYKKKKYTKDTITLSTKEYSIIPQKEIYNLFVELNVNKENFNEDFLKSSLIKPSDKQILKIAKQHDNKSYLINDYTKKETIEKRLTEIKNFTFFEKFLSIDKPDINIVQITSDAWNNLNITRNNEIYSLDFFNNLGQPISIKETDVKTNKQIINLNVNLILQRILPSKSNINKTVNLNNITEKYINWFLENKLFEIE